MAPRPRFRVLPRRRLRLQLESLEDRTTPSTDITALGGDFTVTDGAGGSVNLTLGRSGGNYVLQISGGTFNLPSPIPGVTLDVGSIQATIPAANVDSWNFLLGDQDDSLVVGSGTLDSFDPVTVGGGGGNDTLTLNDSADSTANTYTISATSVSRTGSVTVDYSAMVQVSLTAGTGNDIINVTATAAATPVTVSGGAGNDTVTVGSAGNSLDGVLGAVTVNGDANSGDADRLNIDDQSTNDNISYKVTATTIDRKDAGTITYATVEEVVLNTTNKSNKADSITVESSASASPVTVNGGDGNDTVTVGNGSLDGLLGKVSVAGGLGTDVLKIDDSADGDGNTYNVDTAEITRTGAANISYAGVATVNLTAGSGGDTITVPATTAGVTVNVDAGTGSDSITVGDGTLDNLDGSLTLNAGLGDTDTLSIDDSADTTNNTYTVSATTASRTTGTDVIFNYASSGFEQVALSGGIGTDTITVSATANGIPVTVNGGAGNDTVTAPTLDDLLASLSLDGGTGVNDQLVVNDSAQTSGHTYAVSGLSVQRTDGTPVALTYSSFDHVTLSAGSGDDTIAVTSTAGGSSLTVNSGSGKDIISVAAT